MDSNRQEPNRCAADGSAPEETPYERITRRAALRKIGVTTFQGFALSLAPGALLGRPARAANGPTPQVEATSAASSASGSGSSFASVNVTVTNDWPVTAVYQSFQPVTITANAGRSLAQAPDPAKWNAIWSWSIVSQQNSADGKAGWAPSNADLVLTDGGNDTTSSATAALGGEFYAAGYYRVHLAASVNYVNARNSSVTHGPYVGNVYLGRPSWRSSKASASASPTPLQSSASQSFQGSPGSSTSLGSLSPIGGNSSLASAGSFGTISGSPWPSSAYASLTSLDFGSIDSVGSVGYV
jgi:hypothetical protein